MRGSITAALVFVAVVVVLLVAAAGADLPALTAGSQTASLWGRLKVGRRYGKRFATQREAMDEVIDGLTFHNHRGLHPKSGHVSPMRFEEHWPAGQSKQAAHSSGCGLRRSEARSAHSRLQQTIWGAFGIALRYTHVIEVFTRCFSRHPTCVQAKFLRNEPG